MILAALAIYAAGVMSPGPSFTLVTRLAASRARRAALGATLGLSIGAATHAILSMTGLALIITRVGWLMTAVQIAGGCYLIYLGLASWFSPAVTPQRETRPNAADNAARGFRMGLLLELSNPKSIAFFVSIFAVVVPVEAALWAKTVILLGGLILDIAWYGLAAILLSTRPVQVIYQKFSVWIERLFGTLLAGFGVRLIAEKI